MAEEPAAAKDDAQLEISPLQSCRESLPATLVCLVLLGASAAAVTGYMVVGLTTVEEEFGVSKTVLGVVMAMDDMMSLVLAVPTAHCLQGHKPLSIGAGGVLFGAAAVAYGAAPWFGVLLAAAALMGAGKVPMWVLTAPHIDDNVTDKYRMPELLMRLKVAVLVGTAVGMGTGGLLLDGSCGESDSSAGGDSCGAAENVTLAVAPSPAAPCGPWRVGFFALGGLLLPVGAAVATLRPLTRAPSPSARHRQEAAGSSLSCGRQLASALASNPRLMLSYLRIAIGSFFLQALVPFLPWFLEQKLCLGKGTASAFMLPLVAAVGIGTALGGVLVSRLEWGVGRQFLWQAVTDIAAFPFLFVFLFTEAAAVFIPITAMLAGTLALPAAASSNIVLRVVPPELKAHATAVAVNVGKLCSVPGPIVMGSLLDREGTGSVPSAKVLFFIFGLPLTLGHGAIALANCAIQRRLTEEGEEGEGGGPGAAGDDAHPERSQGSPGSPGESTAEAGAPY
eukprot:TRINITY_DN51524_c0_g1_i1.p1 TRINITY_DN51524_c0_g1~~TRINITY_DN51524_c0_g1_i1.p1  ORF type:complete len:507 (+),score=93.49 TRINITY_DN51524_c0_g1_i1:123-1643(+)